MKIFFKQMSGDFLEIEYENSQNSQNVQSYKDLFFQKYHSYQYDQVSFMRDDDLLDIFDGETINIFIKPIISFVIWKDNDEFVINVYDEPVEILSPVREIKWREMNGIPQRYKPVKALRTQLDYWNNNLVTSDRNIVNALSYMLHKKISEYCCEFSL
jgi:hypothetical protein